ncbi:hypothetical protein BDF20DRAFT_910191 [Mycotypha africana]|uniref:uncharacterized protein n=1 Tax=Mycotypha africana TaxID=64632 RepID=UPI002300BAC2|nr:uncharacterized protein BDF20DRAFT_910191 [Mycotypha africana]KAI8987604.1 hypothetical protein BDF20DRAFT_910191 [Mycotypha africana]
MNQTYTDVTTHLQQPHIMDTNYVTMATPATANTDPNLYALSKKRYHQHYYSNHHSNQNEQYFLYNSMYNNYNKKIYQAQQQQQTVATTEPMTPPPPPLRPNQLVSTNRLAYVEALVDINAVVIESIWYPKTATLSTTTLSTQKDSRISPVVPLRTFIQEVLKRSRTTYSTLQTALFYLFRSRPIIVQHLQQQQQQQQQQQKKRSHDCDWQCNAYISCGRRMFLASLVVASKFVQDKTYRNSAWAKIAGLSVNEINTAERYFLSLLDYRLYIDLPIFDRWHRLLHLRTQARMHNIPISVLDLSTCLSFAPCPNNDIMATATTFTDSTSITPITPTLNMAYPSINTNTNSTSEPSTPTLVHSYSSSISPITNINISTDKPATVFYYSSPLSLSTINTATTSMAASTPPVAAAAAATTTTTTTVTTTVCNNYCSCSQCSPLSIIPNHSLSSLRSLSSSPTPQTPITQISPVRYYSLKRKFDHLNSSSASSSSSISDKKHCRFWQ